MIDLVIAVLLYIGAVNSSAEVNQTVIDQNQSAIEYYQSDSGFQDYYENQYSQGSITILDIYEEN